MAWSEREGADRLALLRQAWADDGSYVDPTIEARVVGRQALADHIGAFLEDSPGAYFESGGWIAGDEHHGFMHFRWRLCGPEGEVVIEGVDFLELGADGRIHRATGFFAPET